MRNSVLFLAMMALAISSVWGQLNITSEMTLEEYVNDILLGSGVSASNITYTGSMLQLGYLENGDADFSVSSGLVLSTEVAEATDCGTTAFCNDCIGLFTDDDLLDIANSVPPLIGQAFTVGDVNDGCILEFDFTATGDTVRFNYVFASDEYLTYVNTQYNDVFAFFLSGPGITGPYASPAAFPDGAINIAEVPDSDPSLPITISSVNPNTNSEFYINNPGGQDPCINGFTVPFTAEHPVECGETYHIKLAIADGSDGALESIVVLEEGSFTSTAVVDVDLSIDVGGPEENTIYEGCGTATLTFTRPIETILELEEMVIIDYSSSVGQNGIDFTLLPDTIVFPPNVNTVSFELQAFEDGILEPAELVVFEILNLAACNNEGLVTYFEFEIADDPDPISIVAPGVQMCPGESRVLYPEVTGGYGHYSYEWCDGSGADTLVVSPPESYTCTLIVGDTCALPTASASFDVEVLLPPNATAGEDLIACGSATMEASIIGLPAASCTNESGAYTYCYDNGVDVSFTYCPDDPGDGSFMTIAFDAGSVENWFDEFWVYDGPDTSSPLLAGPIYGDLSGMTFTANNPGGCLTIALTPDFSVSCTSGSQTEWAYNVGCTNAGGVNWLWTPSDGLSSTSLPNPLVTITDPTVYTMQASLAYYPFCSMTDEVLVTPSFSFSFTATDPTCFGNDGEVEVEVTPNGTTGPWTIEAVDANGAVVASALNFSGISVLEGLSPGDYEIWVSDSYCDAMEPTTLASPALMTITASSDTTICINGMATLVAEPSFPDPNLNWFWSTDEATASIEVGPVGPTLYTVEATYGAGCLTNEVQILVDQYDPLAIELTADDAICIGDSAAVGVNEVFGGLEPYAFSWSAAGPGGSFNPSVQSQDVSPDATTTYCVEVTDGCETPLASGCVEVVIPELVDPGFVTDTLGGCHPLTIGFESIASNPEFIVSEHWSFGDGDESTSLGLAYHTYINEGIWDIEHTVVTVDGCVFTSFEPAYLQTYDPPTAEFAATPWQSAVPLTYFEFTEYAFNEATYAWDFGGLGTSDLPNPDFTFPEDVAAEYPITLTVQNAWGCTDAVTHSILVQESFVLFIPNMFTPDMDGLNDAWKITGIDVDETDFIVQVFNRWGEVIYASTDIHAAWVGDVDGGTHFAANGTYLWRVETKSRATGERKEVLGHVTIAR